MKKENYYLFEDSASHLSTLIKELEYLNNNLQMLALKSFGSSEHTTAENVFISCNISARLLTTAKGILEEMEKATIKEVK